MRVSLVAVVSVVALAACGSPGSFSGKVSGQGLDVKSSAFASVSNLQLSKEATGGQSVGSVQGAAIVLSSAKDVCAEATAKQIHHGQGYLMLIVTKLGTGNGAITTGTYPVQDPNDQAGFVGKALTGVGLARLLVEDGSCTNVVGDAGAAVSGSLNINGLTSGSSGTADGSFQLSMGPQKDAVSGSFSANYCPGVEAIIQTVFEQVSSGDTTTSLDNILHCS